MHASTSGKFRLWVSLILLAFARIWLLANLFLDSYGKYSIHFKRSNTNMKDWKEIIHTGTVPLSLDKILFRMGSGRQSISTPLPPSFPPPPTPPSDGACTAVDVIDNTSFLTRINSPKNMVKSRNYEVQNKETRWVEKWQPSS